MRNFRIGRFVGHLFLSAMALCGSIVYAAPAETIRYVIAANLDAGYGSAVAQFKADLAYQADAAGVTMIAMSSDLRRDRHGFRQASADEYQGFAASPC